MLPILFQSPEFILYSYPLLMGVGWGVAYQIFFNLAPYEVPRRFLMLLYWGIFLFAWLGAKLFFILSIPRDLAGSLLMEASFWTGGGFVFLGGLTGGLGFLLLYKFLRFPFKPNLLSAILPSVAFGHSIGRMGCFLAGCCFGKETSWFWGIHLHGEYRHPTQLLEALGLVVLGVWLMKLKNQTKQQLILYLLFYGLLRFGLEYLRGDEIRGQWGLFTPSQWISLIMIAAGLTIRSCQRRVFSGG